MNHYPSLIIIMNGHEARWYEIEESTATQIARIESPKSTYSDHEGQFSSSGAGSSAKTGNPEVVNQEREAHLKQFCHQVSEKTETLWKNKYQHITLVVPEYLKNQAGDPITQKTGIKDINYVFGNHHEAKPKQVLELFKESIKIHPK